MEHDAGGLLLPEDISAVADGAHELLLRERAARDPEERARIGAELAGALGPDALAAIAARLAEEPERYHVFVDLLQRAGEPGAAAVVQRLADAETIAERRVYFDLLHILDGVVPTLVRQLGDARWFVVRNAIELLGLLEAKEATASLAALMRHPDTRVRLASALALSRIGTAEAQGIVRAMLQRLDGDASDSAAAALIGAEPGAVTRLVEALDRERDEEMLRAIFLALGRVGNRTAVERLARVARGEEERPLALRVAAVEALGEAGTRESFAALRSLLRDSEPRIRGAARWAVGGGSDD